MPNGKPGDHDTWTDFFIHEITGKCPEDMAAMLRTIRSVAPGLLQHLGLEPDLQKWMNGNDLDTGRARLRQIIADYNISFSG